jgi:hypothetical protein
MRITLLCTDSLRTPACPGFGVSGDRKISCFDRFGRQRDIGRELGLRGGVAAAFERVQTGAGLGDRGGREAYFGGAIERVQMVGAGARPGSRAGVGSASRGGIAPEGDSFERVQIGRESVLRLAGAARPVGAFARAQVSWGLGRPTARRHSSSPSFERVQTGLGFAVWRGGGRTAGAFERVQMGDGLGMRGAETHASAGLFERVQMRVRFVMRRGAMPRLK